MTLSTTEKLGEPKTITSKENVQAVRWWDIREAWRELSMALITTARLRFDRELFESYISDLELFMSDYPGVAQKIHHERCLWALFEMDFKELEKLLLKWDPESFDPIWMTRKTALMVEMGGHKNEALELLNRSLSTVRKVSHSSTIASQSREGWMLWMAIAIDFDRSNSSKNIMDRQQIFERWQELAKFDCNAHSQKYELLDAMKVSKTQQNDILFDLGVRRKSINFSNVEYKRLIAAYKAVRLCEVAGLPPMVANSVVGSDLIAQAADCLGSTNPALACRLTLRLLNYDRDQSPFNRIWSRSRVAAIPMEEVNQLFELTKNAMEYALSQITEQTSRSNHQVRRLCISMEALSRLVLRVTPEVVKKVFSQALKYYSLDRVAQNDLLVDPTRNLLKRTWEALSKPYQKSYVFEILGAPIVGLNGFKAFNSRYFEPGELLEDCEKSNLPDRTPDTEARWAASVQLIIQGLRSNGDARQRAAIRLIPIAFGECITDPEKSLIAKSLWDQRYTDKNDLPAGTGLSEWRFFLLPEPEPDLTEKRFRQKWFNVNIVKVENDIKTYKYLAHLGNNFLSLRVRQRPLKLTDVERKNLQTIIEQWIKLPLPPSDSSRITFGFGSYLNFSHAIRGIQQILPEIELSQSMAEALFLKLKELSQTEHPGYRLYSYLAKILPDRIDEIIDEMRIGLLSDKSKIAEEALLGIHSWLKSSLESTSIALPDELLHEVGIMIAVRRKDVLDNALQIARWIFTNGSRQQHDLLIQSTLHGLRYLAEELDYQRSQDDEYNWDVPLLRWNCAHLALAMSTCGFEDDPTVLHWMEIAKNDPLPEVRHAERPIMQVKNAHTDENESEKNGDEN